MNKTFTINLGGIVFHIEEDAFDVLSQYLNAIKGHYTHAQGRDEILADIEARLAELLSTKVGKNRQALVLADIQEVIGLMGKPEDIFDGEPTAGPAAQPQPEKTRRRVYRDPDDKVIGGVCSGIANYFDFDPLWIRLAFAVSFFAFGSGFLFYILLLIVIPEAKTASEKLEMRGERVDIHSIGKTVNEELGRVKDRVNTVAEEAKNSARRARNDARGLTGKVLNALYDLVYYTLRFGTKMLAAIFILVGLALMVALMGSLFGFGGLIHLSNNGISTSYSLKDIFLIFFNDEDKMALVGIGLFLMIGIPLLMLVYKGLRILFRIPVRNRAVSITASLLFLLGVAICLWMAIDLGAEFKTTGRQVQAEEIKTPKGGVLYIEAKNNGPIPDEEDDEDLQALDEKTLLQLGKWNLLRRDGKAIAYGNAQFDVLPSKTDSFELAIFRIASGATKKEATARANSIQYRFAQMDSVVQLGNYYETAYDQKWRNQKVKVRLRVPVGKVVFLSPSLKDILYDVENVSNTLDSDMMGRRWVMQTDGLHCMDCKGINTNSESSDWDEDEEDSSKKSEKKNEMVL